jgi:hypothetical protein
MKGTLLNGARTVRMALGAAPALLAVSLLAQPASAQCWSGGGAGKGVPREALLVINQAPFAVSVMAGLANGRQRVLGRVPAHSTMSFLAALPPGRNEATVWVDAEQSAAYKLPAPRATGLITIVNRGARTCRRAARLVITRYAFNQATRRNRAVARRGNRLSTLAPAAGPQRRAVARTSPRRMEPGRTEPARAPGPPNGGAGVIRY